MFDENLDVFFPVSEFGEVVTVVATGREFNAIFDEAYFDPEAGETVLDASKPRLTCKAADLAGVVRKAVVMVKGREFTVISVQPDGTGTAAVELSLQTPDD